MADYAFQHYQSWTDHICECSVLLALFELTLPQGFL